jgi:predicted Zn-dependent peptidase
LRSASRRGLGLHRLLALLLALLSLTGAAGCRKRVAPVEPVEAAAIELDPRCAEALAGPARAFGIDASEPAEPGLGFVEAPRIESLSRGVRFVFERTPRSGLASLSWGFRLPADLSSPDARVAPSLAAALLQAGETASEPDRFRSHVLAAGAEISASVVGGWLWLEMRFPEPAAETAQDLFFEWLTPRPVDADGLETIRRQWVLARLAEQSAPGALAVEVFRRVHPAPPGALPAPAWWEAAPDPTPEQVQDLLASVFQPEGSVVMLTSARAAEPAIAAIERGLRAWDRQQTNASSAPLSSDPPARAPVTTHAALAQAGDPAIYVVDRPGSPQVEVLVGHVTPAVLDAEFEALEMLASLLGGNVGGRLFRDLRERQGLAYIIDAEQSHEGRFVVSTRARPERVPALLSGIEAHLQALVSVPLEACETRMIVARRLGEEALLANDPNAARRRARIDVALLGAPRSAAFERARIFEAVALGLDEVARRRLAARPTIVLVGEAAVLADGLASFFPDRDVRVFEPDLSDLPRRPSPDESRGAEEAR